MFLVVQFLSLSSFLLVLFMNVVVSTKIVSTKTTLAFSPSCREVVVVGNDHRGRRHRTEWTSSNNSNNHINQNHDMHLLFMQRNHQQQRGYQDASSRDGDSGHGNNKNNNNNYQWSELERDVQESTRERLDMKRLAESLLSIDTSTTRTTSTALSNGNQLFNPTKKSPSSTTFPPWKIAVAAGIGMGGISYWGFSNLYLSGVMAALTVWVAMGDPIEEDGVAGTFGFFRRRI